LLQVVVLGLSIMVVLAEEVDCFIHLLILYLLERYL
jgi:hypothetical protein